MICFFTLQLFWIPNVTQSKALWIFTQSQFTKGLFLFPLFSLTNSFGMEFPVLNGFVEKLMQGVHSHSNGDKTSFHLEINIMMTLKLVMKHIFKRRREGHGWGLWKEGALLDGDHKELRAFLRRESRCKGQTAPRWLAWFCCISLLVNHPAQ